MSSANCQPFYSGLYVLTILFTRGTGGLWYVTYHKVWENYSLNTKHVFLAIIWFVQVWHRSNLNISFRIISLKLWWSYGCRGSEATMRGIGKCQTSINRLQDHFHHKTKDTKTCLFRERYIGSHHYLPVFVLCTPTSRILCVVLVWAILIDCQNKGKTTYICGIKLITLAIYMICKVNAIYNLHIILGVYAITLKIYFMIYQTGWKP